MGQSDEDSDLDVHEDTRNCFDVFSQYIVSLCGLISRF